MTRAEAYALLEEGKKITHLKLKPDDCWFEMKDGVISDNLGRTYTNQEFKEWFDKPMKFDLGWFEYSLEIRDRKYYQFEKQREEGY